MRGGGGGSAVCGAAGFFAGWIPLATAFFVVVEDGEQFGVHVRCAATVADCLSACAGLSCGPRDNQDE